MTDAADAKKAAKKAANGGVDGAFGRAPPTFDVLIGFFVCSSAQSKTRCRFICATSISKSNAARF